MKASPFGKTRTVVAMTAVLALLACSFGVAHAAGEWKPAKPIQFIVPYAPGGGSDVLARSIDSVIKAEKLSPVQLLVVNQPGGSGTIGADAVAKSPPDG